MSIMVQSVFVAGVWLPAQLCYVYPPKAKKKSGAQNGKEQSKQGENNGKTFSNVSNDFAEWLEHLYHSYLKKYELML